MDEFKCLIVTVSVPSVALPMSTNWTVNSSIQKVKLAKLPVLAYIHGGGLTQGKTDQQHNAGNIVEQSIKDAQPVITVNIQYRLNAQGFLISQDLVDAAKANNEPSGNYGLYDQRNALLWIKKYIAGFGGDPDDVTVFGESAGATSIQSHILANVPLFRRAILQSNAITIFNSPYPLPAQQQRYDTLLGLLNISTSDPERLAKLKAVPVAEIVSASAAVAAAGYSWGLYADSEFFPAVSNWNDLNALTLNSSWVEEVVLGNIGDEAYIFLDMAQSITPSLFAALVEEVLGATNSSQLLAAYNISLSMDQNLFVNRVMDCIGGLIFYNNIHSLAQAYARSGKKTYRYFFDMRNPFPGTSYYQTRHHGLDVYYVFATFLSRLPTTADIDVSLGHTSRWAAFANGKAPWKPYVSRMDGGDETVAVADGWESWTTRSRKVDEMVARRNYARMESAMQLYAGLKTNPFYQLNLQP